MPMGTPELETATLQKLFASGGVAQPGLYRLIRHIEYPLKKGPPIILDGCRIEWLEPEKGYD